MPRPTKGNLARTKSITFRLDKETLALVHQQRGILSVSDYLNTLILRDALGGASMTRRRVEQMQQAINTVLAVPEGHLVEVPTETLSGGQA